MDFVPIMCVDLFLVVTQKKNVEISQSNKRDCKHKTGPVLGT